MLSIVLVHGGFVDGSGWEAVYQFLRQSGHTVTVVQNPTISLADDVAYTKALLDPAERTAAASVTSLARSAGSSASPVFSGLLLQGPVLALGLPFVFAGALKSLYDLVLWTIFRRVPLGGSAPE